MIHHQMKLTSKQTKALIECKAHIQTRHPDSMGYKNAEHIRRIHNKHFPDLDCFACVLTICDMYFHLMGGLRISKYYELKQEIDSIHESIKKGFAKYGSNAIKLPSHS